MCCRNLNLPQAVLYLAENWETLTAACNVLTSLRRSGKERERERWGERVGSLQTQLDLRPGISIDLSSVVLVPVTTVTAATGGNWKAGHSICPWAICIYCDPIVCVACDTVSRILDVCHGQVRQQVRSSSIYKYI